MLKGEDMHSGRRERERGTVDYYIHHHQSIQFLATEQILLGIHWHYTLEQIEEDVDEDEDFAVEIK